MNCILINNSTLINATTTGTSPQELWRVLSVSILIILNSSFSRHQKNTCISFISQYSRNGALHSKYQIYLTLLHILGDCFRLLLTILYCFFQLNILVDTIPLYPIVPKDPFWVVGRKNIYILNYVLPPDVPFFNSCFSLIQVYTTVYNEQGSRGPNW